MGGGRKLNCLVCGRSQTAWTAIGLSISSSISVACAFRTCYDLPKNSESIDEVKVCLFSSGNIILDCESHSCPEWRVLGHVRLDRNLIAKDRLHLLKDETGGARRRW